MDQRGVCTGQAIMIVDTAIEPSGKKSRLVSEIFRKICCHYSIFS